MKIFSKYLLFYILSSFLISFQNFSQNCNEDILRLVFAFVGSFATSGSVPGTAAGSGVEILSKFFIGNNLILKLLRTFSLALNNNPKIFLKYSFLQVFLHLFQISFIH